MSCQYCGNKSGKTDGRGNCISCGGPIEKEIERSGYWDKMYASGLMTKQEARERLGSNILIENPWNSGVHGLDLDKMLHKELLRLGYTMYDIVEIDGGFGSSRTLPAVVQRGGYTPAKFKINFDMDAPGGIIHIRKLES